MGEDAVQRMRKTIQFNARFLINKILLGVEKREWCFFSSLSKNMTLDLAVNAWNKSVKLWLARGEYNWKTKQVQSQIRKEEIWVNGKQVK